VPFATPAPVATSTSDRNRRSACDLAYVIGDTSGDVDAGDVDRILELHGRVDLTDEQSIAILEQIDGEHSTSHRRSGVQ
jgi:hypothetical protein